MGRPKKEQYIPRSISKGKPSPVCISVEKFLEMERTIKEQQKEIKQFKKTLKEIMITAEEEGSPQDWVYYDIAKIALEKQG